jgi:predicted ATPase/class 3 adenylate cyclase
METAISFGYWIRRQRKALDLTQQALAEQVGCSVAAIKKIEGDERRPSRQIAERVADVLGVPSDQREIFLEVARGVRSIQQLSLAREPTEIPALSKGIVTLLFTDVEDSTKLWESAAQKMKLALQRHHAILQEAISSNGGDVFQIIGDAFCAAFPTAPSAISAAVIAQWKLHQEPWDLPFPIHARMGIHTGEIERTSTDSPTGGYASNQTMNRVARILSAGHGGQVLLSLVTKELVEDSLPPKTSLRDMGEHRLKNLTRPEHLFQLNIAGLPSDFPPLNTLDSHRHNLPLQLTSFIGREREIADVIRLLEKARLVTLTGAGGTGKTRLSIQVANELLDQYPDGVWMVELAPILDPLLVSRTTAIAIGLRDEPHRPVIDMLCDYLREKKLLLILDNCEHLVEACAHLADRVLHAAPHVRFLASSREVLGIAGEVTYRVPSLGLPDVNHLPSVESVSQYEAIQLFIDRATSVLPTFIVTNDNVRALAQVCSRLDGIPLAIELAAAKVRALSAEQIAKRLDDRFRLLTGGSRTALERHQTLRAAIDWSYNLLSPAEQIFFRRLAIFVGGWTLEAAEFVCADESLQVDNVLNLLEQLINKSLIVKEETQNETRYHMLETMRQYANENLVESGESDSLRDRHLEYFLNLAETAEPHLIRPEQLKWLARLDVDYENLRAALEWSLSKESPEPSLRLCAALGTFWVIRCYWMEGSKWFESAFFTPSQNISTEKIARVRALYQDAKLARNLGHLERMKISAESSLTLAQEGSDKRDIAIARLYVGIALKFRGDDYNALSLFQRSLAEFRELNDPYWESYCYGWLSDILVAQGKLKRAERNWKNLELARKAGEGLNLAEALWDYSYSLFSSNQVDEARKHARAADDLCKQIGSTRNTASFFFAELAWLNGVYEKARSIYIDMQERLGLLGEKNLRSAVIADLGVLALEQGDIKQAQAYIEESLATAREIDNKHFIANRLAELANVFYFQGNREMCKQYFRESTSRRKELGRYANSYILLLLLNTIYIEKPESATRILGAIGIAQRENFTTIGPKYKRYCDRAEAYARKTLDDAAFESAFVEGQKMSLDEALDVALKTVEEM